MDMFSYGLLIGGASVLGGVLHWMFWPDTIGYANGLRLDFLEAKASRMEKDYLALFAENARIMGSISLEVKKDRARTVNHYHHSSPAPLGRGAKALIRPKENQ